MGSEPGGTTTTTTESVTEEMRLLSPRDVEAILGISSSYARQLMRSGEIRSFKLGTLRKVHREDLEEFIEKRRAGSRTER